MPKVGIDIGIGGARGPVCALHLNSASTLDWLSPFGPRFCFVDCVILQ